ncbi:hypothetical protein JMJ35_008194 [Cladonia borealis]|uniref:Uncharacterized protein n=1 Tax=Cladonia borealis TaxID=184061 RepID=A0AA39QV82_9LECA|nr:hypothetical protein JMJ35_008194 [Cladonia borealis]
MTLPSLSQLAKSQKPSEAAQYLPGGQKYQKSLVDNAKNPRQGLPASQWIANWDASYADNAQEAQPTSGIKAPDKLQRDLTMLVHMSEVKRETDDGRPEGRNPEDTRVKDNK